MNYNKNGYEVIISETCVRIYEGKFRHFCNNRITSMKEGQKLADAWFLKQREMIESGELIALEE